MAQSITYYLDRTGGSPSAISRTRDGENYTVSIINSATHKWTFNTTTLPSEYLSRSWSGSISSGSSATFTIYDVGTTSGVPLTGTYSFSFSYSSILISYVATFTITFIDSDSVKINVNGTWSSGSPYVNIGGTWKKGTMYVNVGGTWKKGG